MNYKLAIFDLDGTVLDTLDDLADSLNFALDKNGFNKRTVNEVRSFVGNGIRRLIERGVPENCPPEKIDAVHADFTAYYKVHCADKTKPYDGIPEVLSDLKKSNIKVSIVSNKADYAVQALCKKYFDGLYDFAVGERVGVSRKPSPDSVNEVLNNLGIKKEDAVYIGDSEVDIETAKNAKMNCISVCWGFRDFEFLKECGASVILNNPNELLSAI